MPLKFFASIVAVRYSGKGEEVDHLPVSMEADSYDEALEVTLQRWPRKERWEGHDAVSILK